MHLLQRLAAVYRNRRRFLPDPSDRAGRIAELRASDALVERLEETPVRVWPARRIPDHVTGRRLEFDLVVVAEDEVALIELKNWVGSLELDDGRMIQRSPRGGVVDHGRLFARLDERLQTFRTFCRERDIEPPPLRSLLVFVHPDLSVSQEVADENHQVVRLANGGGRLEYGRHSEALVEDGIVRLLEDLYGASLDSESDERRSDDLRRLCDALDTVGTWDALELYGGRILTGDVRWIVSSEHELSDRARWWELEADVARSYVDGIRAKPSVRIEGVARTGEGRRFEDLQLEDVVAFRPAGADDMLELELRHLERLRYGYAERTTEPMCWEDLDPGSRHLGRVANVVDFGLFVDVGGPTDGLVHIGNVEARGRTEVRELRRRFECGDVVDVRVTGVRPDDGEIDLHLVHHRPKV